MQTLNEYVWVFVGCGGTFYAASPYLAVLARCHAPREVIMVDPDEVEESNYNRQWPGYNLPGSTKVNCAEEALGLESLKLASRFQEVGNLLDEATNGQPVLAVVNVDNDQTRLDVARWLESRVSPGIMIVSGCERMYGQAYPGIWMGGQPIYDWRKIHTDVGEKLAGSTNSCQVQNVRANALTGVLVGMCIEDIADRLEQGNLQFVREFFWNIDREITRMLNMWTTTFECERGIQDDCSCR